MLLFITNSGCGGAERMTVLYAKILQQAGHDCRLLVVQKNGMDFNLRQFIPASLPWDLFQCRRVSLPFLVIGYINRCRPVCIFDSLPLITMALSRSAVKWLFPGVKLVFRECNTPFSYTMLQLFFTRFSLRKINAVISQTEAMRQEMVKCYALPPEHITVIHNPIDESFIREQANECYRFVESDCIHYIAVARVEPQKDYQTLLRAFAKVNLQCPKSRLHILGDYSYDRKYKRELDKTVRELKLERTVHFAGFQTNPYKYIVAANVFVLSSAYEGLPNVVQEAMYLGKPVVATRCIPYISQIIEAGVNGYTVRVGNYEELAEAMIKAASLHTSVKFMNFAERDKRIVDLFNSLFD